MAKQVYQVGDIVLNVAAGIQGKVIAYDAEHDLYEVEFRSFTSFYTAPMLKRVAQA